MARHLTLDLDAAPPTTALELRARDLRADPDRMRAVEEFVDEVVEAARAEAARRARERQKAKFDANFQGFQNGSRRIGQWSSRARTSARTFATRLFTAICHCTNTVKSAVVNRN